MLIMKHNLMDVKRKIGHWLFGKISCRKNTSKITRQISDKGKETDILQHNSNVTDKLMHPKRPLKSCQIGLQTSHPKDIKMLLKSIKNMVSFTNKSHAD